MTCRTPTIKYKLVFCDECNDQIANESEEEKCDNCKKSFHVKCTDIQQTREETIWLCKECNSNSSICTERDTIEIKHKQTNSQSTRILRSRIQSIDRSKPISEIKSNKSDTKKNHSNVNTNDRKFADIEAKVLELEKRLKVAEENECKCVNAYDTRMNKIEKFINELHQKTDDKIVQKIKENKQSETVNMSKIKKSVITKKKKKSKIKELRNTIVSINKKIDSCEAMHETNVTFDIEIQKQIIDINDRLNDCEALNQLSIGHENVVSSLTNTSYGMTHKFSETPTKSSLNKAIMEFGKALTRHNNTIKTHFKLNEAYNSDVMEKINGELEKIINSSNNDRSKHIMTVKSKPGIKSANVVSCEIGKVSIRSLHPNKRMCNQIRIHIYDAKCMSLDEARNFISDSLAKFDSSIVGDNTTWFTTKMVLDSQSQTFKRLNLIADLHREIDVEALKNFMKRVFD